MKYEERIKLVESLQKKLGELLEELRKKPVRVRYSINPGAVVPQIMSFVPICGVWVLAVNDGSKFYNLTKPQRRVTDEFVQVLLRAAGAAPEFIQAHNTEALREAELFSAAEKKVTAAIFTVRNKLY